MGKNRSASKIEVWLICDLFVLMNQLLLIVMAEFPNQICLLLAKLASLANQPENKQHNFTLYCMHSKTLQCINWWPE
jgi:hypothetical protein